MGHISYILLLRSHFPPFFLLLHVYFFNMIFSYAWKVWSMHEKYSCQLLSLQFTLLGYVVNSMRILPMLSPSNPPAEKKSSKYGWKLSALSATPAFWSLPYGVLLDEEKSCINTMLHSREMPSFSHSHTSTQTSTHTQFHIEKPEMWGWSDFDEIWRFEVFDNVVLCLQSQPDGFLNTMNTTTHILTKLGLLMFLDADNSLLYYHPSDQ